MKALTFIFALLVVSVSPVFAASQDSITVVATNIGPFASFASITVNGTKYFVTEGDIIKGLRVEHIGLHSVRFSDGTIIFDHSQVAKR